MNIAPGLQRVPEVEAFLARHPEVRSIDAFFVDLCGIERGKRLPLEELNALYLQGNGFPGSTFLLDVRGENTDACGRGTSDGDPDCIAKAIPDRLGPVPWVGAERGQVMLEFFEPDGRPYPYSPRNVLAAVIDKLAAKGLSATVAFELEFYLIDPERRNEALPQPPRSPLTGQRETGTQVYGMAQIDGFDALLDQIAKSCTALGVPCGAITAEYAPGQFEINLRHIDDALRAADDAVLFRRAVKGVARQHGLQATFMAKPYPTSAGSGLHLHVSLVDRAGKNIFDGGPEAPIGPRLKHALGGLIAAMPESMAIFAPNLNSFRRYQPGLFVPLLPCWGHENRSAAFRVPLGPPPSRRVEHRVAGADANPYLALAAVLAGMLHGLENELDPGPAVEGNVSGSLDPDVPWRPRDALARLAAGGILSEVLGADYIAHYVACKQIELDRFEAQFSPQEYGWYLLAD